MFNFLTSLCAVSTVATSTNNLFEFLHFIQYAQATAEFSNRQYFLFIFSDVTEKYIRNNREAR